MKPVREPPEDPSSDLEDAVAKRERQQEYWRERGERSLGQNLAMMGALGWLMVIPMLLGAFAGRWLDSLAGGGVMWTAALIFAGAALGGYFVWHRIMEEPE